MSMEHIFRNLNDIRVFDILVDMEEDNPLDTHEILELLDYPGREYIQIQDSIDHLVREQILSIKLVPEETTTGCEECKYVDEHKLPRKKDHESHKPLKTEIVKMEKYYFAKNDLTSLLVSAVFQSSFFTAEKILKEMGKENETVIDETKGEINNED